MRGLKISLSVLLIVALTAVFAACSSNAPPNRANGGSTPQTAFPLKVTDFLGREVTINATPERIVSLAPSITEILYALGAGDMLVGVTDYDDYPEEVKNVAKVGGYMGPNMEAIAAQRPDVIFASTLSGKEQMESLQKTGIPVLMLEASSLNMIYDSIKLISMITGTGEKGDQIIDDMKSRIKQINDRVKHLPEVNVFYLVDTNGNYTAGRGTFIDELITLAGGSNVAGDAEGWVQYSLEKLIENNPDVIITSPHSGGADSLKDMQGFKETSAVRQGKIFVISDDNIVSRASNRIVLGLDEIAKDLHPEAFK